MRNIAFVVWMLGWPWLLSAYPSDEPVSGGASLLIMFIWFAVGSFVYEPKKRNQ